MHELLDRQAFAGPSLDRRWFAASFVGQARFDGYMTFVRWPRGDVERLLPPELEPVENRAEPESHPVAFVFGNQSEGATLFAGFRFPMGIAYPELALAIPYVRHRHGRYLHTFIARMYASYFPPVWHGNVYYGYSKELAHLRWQGPIFLVTGRDGKLLLHAAVEPCPNWSSSDDLAIVAHLRAAFALPVLGRRADGGYACSYFDWDFSDAQARPADVCVSIDAPLLEGMSPRRCFDLAGGSIEVRGMVWRVSWPGQCRF